MAITPEEARQLSADELKVIVSLEEEIDKRLRAGFVEGRQVIFQFPGIKHWNSPPRIIQTLLERYVVAGWKPTYSGVGPHSPEQISFVLAEAPIVDQG